MRAHEARRTRAGALQHGAPRRARGAHCYKPHALWCPSQITMVAAAPAGGATSALVLPQHGGGLQQQGLTLHHHGSTGNLLLLLGEHHQPHQPRQRTLARTFGSQPSLAAGALFSHPSDFGVEVRHARRDEPLPMVEDTSPADTDSAGSSSASASPPPLDTAASVSSGSSACSACSSDEGQAPGVTMPDALGIILAAPPEALAPLGGPPPSPAPLATSAPHPGTLAAATGLPAPSAAPPPAPQPPRRASSLVEALPDDVLRSILALLNPAHRHAASAACDKLLALAQPTFRAMALTLPPLPLHAAGSQAAAQAPAALKQTLAALPAGRFDSITRLELVLPATCDRRQLRTLEQPCAPLNAWLSCYISTGQAARALTSLTLTSVQHHHQQNHQLLLPTTGSSSPLQAARGAGRSGSLCGGGGGVASSAPPCGPTSGSSISFATGGRHSRTAAAPLGVPPARGGARGGRQRCWGAPQVHDAVREADGSGSDGSSSGDGEEDGEEDEEEEEEEVVGRMEMEGEVELCSGAVRSPNTLAPSALAGGGSVQRDHSSGGQGPPGAHLSGSASSSSSGGSGSGGGGIFGGSPPQELLPRERGAFMSGRALQLLAAHCPSLRRLSVPLLAPSAAPALPALAGQLTHFACAIQVSVRGGVRGGGQEGARARLASLATARVGTPLSVELRGTRRRRRPSMRSTVALVPALFLGLLHALAGQHAAGRGAAAEGAHLAAPLAALQPALVRAQPGAAQHPGHAGQSSLWGWVLAGAGRSWVRQPHEPALVRLRAGAGSAVAVAVWAAAARHGRCVALPGRADGAHRAARVGALPRQAPGVSQSLTWWCGRTGARAGSGRALDRGPRCSLALPTCRHVRHLRMLQLPTFSEGGSTLQHLAEHATQLRELRCRLPLCTAGALALRGLPRLSALQLDSVTQLGDEVQALLLEVQQQQGVVAVEPAPTAAAEVAAAVAGAAHGVWQQQQPPEVAAPAPPLPPQQQPGAPADPLAHLSPAPLPWWRLGLSGLELPSVTSLVLTGVYVYRGELGALFPNLAALAVAAVRVPPRDVAAESLLPAAAPLPRLERLAWPACAALPPVLRAAPALTSLTVTAVTGARALLQALLLGADQPQQEQPGPGHAHAQHGTPARQGGSSSSGSGATPTATPPPLHPACRLQHLALVLQGEAAGGHHQHAHHHLSHHQQSKALRAALQAVLATPLCASLQSLTLRDLPPVAAVAGGREAPEREEEQQQQQPAVVVAAAATSGPAGVRGLLLPRSFAVGMAGGSQVSAHPHPHQGSREEVLDKEEEEEEEEKEEEEEEGAELVLSPSQHHHLYLRGGSAGAAARGPRQPGALAGGRARGVPAAASGAPLAAASGSTPRDSRKAGGATVMSSLAAAAVVASCVHGGEGGGGGAAAAAAAAPQVACDLGAALQACGRLVDEGVLGAALGAGSGRLRSLRVTGAGALTCAALAGAVRACGTPHLEHLVLTGCPRVRQGGAEEVARDRPWLNVTWAP